MKKRMKMKKYAEGGMSDDDEGYDAYTTRVVDEDTDEVVYEKPEAKAAQRGASAKPAMRVDDSREMRRVGPVSGGRKSDDTSAVTGRARAGRSSMSAEEKATSNKAMREDVLPEALMLGASAIPVGGAAAALGLRGLRAAKAAKASRRMADTVKAYDAEKAAAAGERARKLKEIEANSQRRKLKLTPGEAERADRIRTRQEMFGSGRTAREFAEAGGMKRGGKVKRYSSGGSVKSSASRRADGIAQRGKTKGRVI